MINVNFMMHMIVLWLYEELLQVYEFICIVTSYLIFDPAKYLRIKAIKSPLVAVPCSTHNNN